MTKKILHYDHPQQFEPLMPAEAVLGSLLERASDLARAAAKLGASAGKTSGSELRTLLRSMNSYYTNRIEGEHTRPSDIERALQQDFSANADLARKQRLAVAHIRTEEQCERTLDQEIANSGEVAVRSLYSSEALQWLHKALFSDLPEQDLVLADGSQLQPGAIRTRQVAVGIHEAPLASALPQFLDRWAGVYAKARRGEASIVALAASHHRLGWIHPFDDGNGRVMRLHTHLLLHGWGFTSGLWSPLRGFARTESKYKALLQAADEHRRGDLDGRGNLSQAALVDWIMYVIDTCIDQIDFMGSMLDVQGMRGRIEAALAFESSALKSGVRTESLNALHYLFSSQIKLPRAEFKAMLGLGDRLASSALSALIKRGYLVSDSPYGDVRFAVPHHALRFYFPNLWPEAEMDARLATAE